MAEQEEETLGQEMGRMPLGHDRNFGPMPKPDVDRTDNFSFAPLVAVFVVVVLLGAVLFLVLPGLGR